MIPAEAECVRAARRTLHQTIHVISKSGRLGAANRTIWQDPSPLELRPAAAIFGYTHVWHTRDSQDKPACSDPEPTSRPKLRT